MSGESTREEAMAMGSASGGGDRSGTAVGSRSGSTRRRRDLLFSAALVGLIAASFSGAWVEQAVASPSLVAVTPLGSVRLDVGLSISADGSTVVGTRVGRENEAYLWTRAEGYRGFDALGPGAPSQTRFQAHGVSGDGSRIVGSLDGQPALWDRSGAIALLPLPAGGTSGGTALAISDDGRRVVGQAHAGGVDQRLVILPGGVVEIIESPLEVPVAWNLDDGSATPLSGFGGAALDVSNDGVAVGTIDFPEFVGTGFGFRWEEAVGLQALPRADPGPGEPRAYGATAISADGRSIVGLTSGPPPPGSSSTQIQPRGYRWNGEVVPGETLPLEGLALIDLPGFQHALSTGPMAISADGSTIVGAYYRNPDVAFLPRPFVWTEGGGFQDLEFLLNALGLSTADWILNGALDVSADGSTIVGTGRTRNSSGRFVDAVWIAVIPEPSTSLLLGMGLMVLGFRSQGRCAVRRPAGGA